MNAHVNILDQEASPVPDFLARQKNQYPSDDAPKKTWTPSWRLAFVSLAIAGASVAYDNHDIQSRADEHGRAGWKDNGTIAITGTEKRLTWRFWETASPLKKSYIVTTDPKMTAPAGTEVIVTDRQYKVLEEVANIAEGMDKIEMIEGTTTKAIPGVKGLDDVEGHDFNGTSIVYNQADMANAVQDLRDSAFLSLHLKQRWNGVAVTGDWLEYERQRMGLTTNAWFAEKAENINAAVTGAWNSTADWAIQKLEHSKATPSRQP